MPSPRPKRYADEVDPRERAKFIGAHAKRKPCLRCGKVFKGKSAYNRICSVCDEITDKYWCNPNHGQTDITQDKYTFWVHRCLIDYEGSVHEFFAT